MLEPGDDRRRKTERESRLRWQSRLLLLLVLIPAALGVALRIFPALTPATAKGLAICAAFGLLVWLLHAATPLAALTGFLLTSCLYLGTVDQPTGGWCDTALLPGLAFFVLAFAATRFRRGRKEQTGLAESRRGRGASQVAANMGVAALAAVAIPPSPLLSFTHGRALIVAVIAALAEAAADTVSSEVGQAVGGMPVLITTLKHHPPGTDGAISLPGTIAGFFAAAFLVLAAIPTLRLDPGQAATAWSAAVCGLFADSLFGATLERRGWLNNDLVNFLSTVVAALLALLI
jgi:uncharacterized protein (TIGR00297 family)